ncbi:hypothetical protein [Kocuria marina]|uniref:hypothetical protein n=1 Tax=Kocuria marina TaxID=223184 RepID=UPI0011A13048|nr:MULTISPECIES: hypothetical protein [Kocuria]MCT2019762.1 hypothetical protein [Kocuria marina]
MITRKHYDDPRWRAKTARSTGAREFRQVMKRLERKGTPAFVQERMAATTGRKRVVSWAAFIRLCTLAAFHCEATFHLVDIMHVADGLTPSQRREVGFSRCDYHHVEYAFKTLAKAGDESICQATGEVKDPRLHMSLDDFIIRLIETPEVAPTSRQALDGTLIETNARRRSWAKDAKPDYQQKSDYLVPADLEDAPKASNAPGFPRVAEDGTLIHSVDGDARDQVQTGKNLSPGNVRLGYEAHFLVDSREPGSPLHAPPIIRAIHLAPGSTHRGDAGIAVLDAMKRVLGHTPDEVLDDRGYSNCKAQNWALPLHERGIKQVFDLHPNNRGVRPGPIKGTQWRDGLLLVSDKVTKHDAVPTRSPLESHAIKDKRAEMVAKRHAFSFGFEDWNLERGTVRLVGPAVRGQVRCVNHPASMRLKAVKQHSRGGRRTTRPTTAHVRGDECACGKTKVVPITEVIRFYQPYVWGSPEWERAYGGRNLSETANSNFKDHHGRFFKGSIKVLGRNKIALALAFFVDAVNTRLIINMPTEFFERWTGSADPYLPDPDDPAWTDPDHEPPATRAGPEGRAVTTSPATLESIIS